MKNSPIKTDKQFQKIHEENSLEKEIEDLIKREKAKQRIMSKLLAKTSPPNAKTDI